jgi:nitroreductase/NAD-dependent dihydropyrimidine dehydrogenase PreA subunit
MPLKTGRFYECAEVVIDKRRCTVCGLCVKVCKGSPLFIEENKINVDQTRVFGCVACGQCMAVCPNGAIKVNGRDMTPDDIVELPDVECRANYDSLKSLMISRRSIRCFKDQNVDSETINKILDAASTSPNGLGSSDVEVLVLDGKEKVEELTADLMAALKRNKWMFSPVILRILKLFMRKETYDSFSTFAVTAVGTFVNQYENGNDWLTYSAPLAIYFHVSPYADPADPYIPATYAVLAAQTLGLGSCMLGVPNIILNYFGKGLKEKYGIPRKNKSGILVIFGYPDLNYSFALKRRFAKINWMK